MVLVSDWELATREIFEEKLELVRPNRTDLASLLIKVRHLQELLIIWSRGSTEFSKAKRLSVERLKSLQGELENQISATEEQERVLNAAAEYVQKAVDMAGSQKVRLAEALGELSWRRRRGARYFVGACRETAHAVLSNPLLP